MRRARIDGPRRVGPDAGLPNALRGERGRLRLPPAPPSPPLGLRPDFQEAGPDRQNVRNPRAGRYVAFERYYRDDLDDRHTVLVLNAATGRALTSAPTGDVVYPDGRPSEGIGDTAALALRRDGAVAWNAYDIMSSDMELEVWAGRGKTVTRVARAPISSPVRFAWQARSPGCRAV